ncbi:tripartite tricarboxylate transporter permease [Fusibacter paucivorans]|uniref:Tripartite tricarboxylate transporter permease n=1 Tax=Fusibacter paucivorans TaxID=76009 RepID=A0ABS5PMW9_9FIRM|nr:tripartite tricarboxylate transporter permease [Fusibacter paucivorans]MBS7525392.1 tripartite tricarboxylate transporter permease [Fusibacter paucivorans]
MTALIGGAVALLTAKNIILMFVGVVVGILFGAIPGLSSTMAIALFLPVTFGLSTYESFALLVALYIGGVSGGLVSAILINIPGSAMSIATTYDGHPMAKNGQAHRALGIGVMFSFLGTVFGLAIMIFAAPVLASFAITLQPFEYFALSFMALTLIASVSGQNIFKGLLAGFLGIAFSTIGMAPIDGVVRFTFGNIQLMNGFTLLPAVIGMFAVTEIMLNVVKPISADKIDQQEREHIKGFGFSMKEMLGQAKNFIVASTIGTVVGFLPGMGGSLANQVAYVAVQKTSKHPEKFGTGIMDGIVASESSNNASIGGAMIPLLALGIPGDGPTAMLLGAFMIHGLVAGPMLFKTSGDLVYLIFAALIICSVIMVVVEFYGIRLIVKALDVPREILYPVVITICVVGAYATNNNMFDVWTLLVFGLLGFFMAKVKLPRACFVLGFVLGTLVETNLRRAVQLSRGSFMPFVTRPITAVLLVVAIIIIIRTVWVQIIKPMRNSKTSKESA